MTKEVTLLVNDQPVELDYFIQSYIDHTTRGILAALEGTGQFDSITDAQVSVQGKEVAITVSAKTIPANSFVSNLVRSTIVGMVSSLKRVATVDTLTIRIEKV